MEMDVAQVDSLYDAFCNSVPTGLCEPARRLAFTLGLAPCRDVPWSAVFNHEVTLAAPRLVAEALPEIGRDLVREAIRAHLLAIVEAFATDRVEDGQVRATNELQSLRVALRAERDLALKRVVSGAPLRVDYAMADRQTLHAIRRERQMLAGETAVTLGLYEAVSAGKQSLGLPASLGLALAAGWQDRRVRALERLLLSVWLGLQEHDDTTDWEEDARGSGAWVICLARGAAPGDLRLSRGSPWEMRRSAVHEAGALATLLRRAGRHFRQAARRAAVLGAHGLAGWCSKRALLVDDLARQESRHPGYVVRARALSGLLHTAGMS
jgi:hypothetical protein